MLAGALSRTRTSLSRNFMFEPYISDIFWRTCLNGEHIKICLSILSAMKAMIFDTHGSVNQETIKNKKLALKNLVLMFPAFPTIKTIVHYVLTKLSERNSIKKIRIRKLYRKTFTFQQFTLLFFFRLWRKSFSNGNENICLWVKSDKMLSFNPFLPFCS